MTGTFTLMTPVYGEIEIPDGVTDLNLFRKWYHSGLLPEKLKVHFINGRVWVDLFMEEFHSHNQVKAALGYTLSRLAVEEKLGLFVPDGMLLRNSGADVATVPDAMFVLHKTLKSKRVTFTAGVSRGGKATELVGTPDLVVEVVSTSSEDKDTEWLMSAYHNAGIPEYWLIDARFEKVRFDIFRRGPKGFVASRPVEGWVKSKLFSRSFAVVRTRGEDGMTTYSFPIR